MRCKSVLLRVDAMRTGELPPEEQEVVHEHLRKCSSCDDSLGDVQTLARTVKSLAAIPPRSCCDKVRAQLSDRYDSVEAFGETVWVAFSDEGIRMLHPGGSAEEFSDSHQKRFCRGIQRAELPDKLRRQVVAAIRGEGVDEPRVDFADDLTEFERKVLQILTTIPRGEVRSYSWVARQAGRPKAVRAVGSICARNDVPLLVPCHRVVPATGGLGDYALGQPFKKTMLEREGAPLSEILLRRRAPAAMRIR